MNKAQENLLQKMTNPSKGGILLLNKSRGKTSFSLVGALRRITGIRKIGHAGTLDPFATGVMVLLIGKEYTKLSSRFLEQDKEYLAKIQFGISTDTFDCDGKQTASSELIPTLAEVENVLEYFQGKISQLPPMYSAKKKKGKKLYEYAREGKEVEREPVEITLHTQLLHYEYPYLELRISCSKGTYIRSIAHDMGNLLGCGGHLQELVRMRSGPFHLKDCIDQARLSDPEINIWPSMLNQLPF